MWAYVLEIDPSLIDRIHRIAIEHGKESELSLRDAIRDEGCIPAICNGDFFEDPVERAAYYLHRISTRHPYVEGNKRTAYLTALLIVHKELGARLIEDQAENDQFIRKIASGEVPQDDVIEWLKGRIVR